MDNHIVLNSAQCNNCKDIIISRHRHDFVTCKCKLISCDGGREYLKRSFQKVTDYKELSIYSDAPFGILRENIYRGSRGKDGLQPLTYVKLSQISNDYLTALIKYCIEHETLGYLSYYIGEQAYRKQNNIYIEE